MQHDWLRDSRARQQTPASTNHSSRCVAGFLMSKDTVCNHQQAGAQQQHSCASATKPTERSSKQLPARGRQAAVQHAWKGTLHASASKQVPDRQHR